MLQNEVLEVIQVNNSNHPTSHLARI